MKYDLVLVELNQQQINTAKRVNGHRKQITHALICGPYGQIFGTKKLCMKYFSVWVEVFPLLFGRRIEMTSYNISDFKSTFNLVNKLIAVHDKLDLEGDSPKKNACKEKKSLFYRLFRW